MPRLKDNQLPSYRLHKQSGQAIVTLAGRDILLGKHGSAESREAYQRKTSEYLASGRRAPVDTSAPITVTEVIAAYWKHVKIYYRKDGKPTSEQTVIKGPLKLLRKLYGRTRADQFGPLALKAVRQALLESELSRRTINHQVGRIKRMFKWAVSEELVPPSVHHGLTAVDGLRRGRSEAKESKPVGPADPLSVDAVVKLLSPSLAQAIHLEAESAAPGTKETELNELIKNVPLESPVAAMIELQRLTGMRSGEVTIMRPMDLAIDGNTGSYTPSRHKTEHHERPRVISLGPRAVRIIQAFMNGCSTEDFLFSPQSAMRSRAAKMRAERKTPLRRAGAPAKKTKGKRRPGTRYDTCSYRRAVDYACTKAKVKAFHPHQLRHTCATQLARKYGFEVARVVLGHSSLAVTELYAERDFAAAHTAMKEVG